MTDNLIHGYSEAELESLNISLSERNECLKYTVPYKRCLVTHRIWDHLINEQFQYNESPCADIKRDYQECQHPKVLNEGAFSAVYLKYHDTKRFNEEKIAPSLEKHYRPTILTTTLGHH